MGQQYRLFSSSLRSLLHSPVTSPLLGPNILLSTLSAYVHPLIWATKFHTLTKQQVRNLSIFRKGMNESITLSFPRFTSPNASSHWWVPQAKEVGSRTSDIEISNKECKRLKHFQCTRNRQLILISVFHACYTLALETQHTYHVTKIQAIYVQGNMKARSWNRCCSRKAISITYSEYVFVSLGIQHAIRMCHIVICVLSSSTEFFHIIS
jgi:sulfur transfer complex TusBCD TusB component (DsrH family)